LVLYYGPPCPAPPQTHTRNLQPPFQNRPHKMTPTVSPPSLFFWLTACTLLILVSVSSPTWNSISFLTVGTGTDKIRFGAFGYTGSNVTSVGYEFPARFLDLKSVPPLSIHFSPLAEVRSVSSHGKLSSGTIHNLTYVLILHPIGQSLFTSTASHPSPITCLTPFRPHSRWPFRSRLSPRHYRDLMQLLDEGIRTPFL